MLNELEVIHFQCHIHTYLEFVKGLNIIRGTSNYGKSALVRAIKWGVDNEPRGIPFLNWDRELSDGVEVLMSFDEGEIARIHNDKFNGYEIPDLGEDGKFEALYSDVPEEVRAITRLDESNIQGQDDGYFLLRESPGNIARKLNERAGLEDIDKVAKVTKSLLDEFSTKLKLGTIDLEEKIKRKKTLDKIAEQKELIEEIDVLFKKKDVSERTLIKLKHTIAVIDEINRNITKNYRILKSEPVIKILSKLLERRLSVVSKRTLLKLIAVNINDLLTAVSMIEKELEARPIVLEMLPLFEERQKIVSKWKSLYNLQQSIEGIAFTIKTEEVDLKRIKNTRDKLLTKIEFCPTCGADKEHWQHEILSDR